jgi:ferric-dicitrate binding protein FerR (iron transport regulator)
MSRVKKIISLFFQNGYRPDIQKKFFIWLINPFLSKEKDQYLQDLWEDIKVPADHSTLDSLYQVKKELGLQQTDSSGTKWIRFARIAATFIIPVLSILASYIYIRQYQGQHTGQVEFVEHFVPNGQFETITFPDGSKATLNSGSIIIYPQEFKGVTRDIYLNGEAYFNVSQDKNKPFIVKTGNINIEVLGTIFNVSAYSDNNNITTTLEEGKIKINFKDDPQESIILMPNEQIIYDRTLGAFIKKQANINNVTAWMQGHLVFQQTSINEIIKTIERRYDVTVYLNSNHYDNEIVTAKFIHGESLEELLQILKEIIPGLRYKIEGKKIFIY